MGLGIQTKAWLAGRAASRRLVLGLAVVVTGAAGSAAAVAALAGGAARLDLALTLIALAGIVVASLAIRTTGSAAGFFTAILILILLLVPVDWLPDSKQLFSLRIDPVLIVALLGFVAPAPIARRDGAAKLLVVILVAAGAIALANNYGLAPRAYFMSYLVVGAIVFLTCLKGSRSSKDLVICCRALCLGAGVASAYGIVEYVLKRNPLYGKYYPGAGPNAGGALYFPETYGYRITTTIGHPLVVAGMLSATLVILVGLSLASESRWERRVSLFVAVLCFVALMMTKSRFGVILGPSAVIVLLISLRGNARARRLAVVLVLGLAVGLFATQSIWAGRFSSSQSSSSTQARVLGLQYIETAVPKGIPFGLGYGASQARVGSQGETISGASAEDGWAELLIDGGPFVFLPLFLLPLLGTRQAVAERGREPLRLAVKLAALAMTVDTFSSNGIIVERPFLFFLLMLAAVSAPMRPSTAQATANSAVRGALGQLPVHV